MGIPFALLKSNLNLLNVKLVIIVRQLPNAPKIICPTRLYLVLCESIVRFKQSAMRALAALPRQSAQRADLVTKGIEVRAFRYLVKAPPATLWAIKAPPAALRAVPKAVPKAKAPPTPEQCAEWRENPLKNSCAR